MTTSAMNCSGCGWVHEACKCAPNTSNISNELDDLIERFEHEYDIATEKLQITKPVFDGRIGDPSLALKRSLTRFLKHHAAAYLKQECDRARADELAKLIPHTERWPWKADPRIKGLTMRDWIPIEVINTRLAELKDLNQGGEDE